jgi:hypothetical protein
MIRHGERSKAILSDCRVAPLLTMTSFFSRSLYFDDLVKGRKSVTPAKAGVQNLFILLDSRFRGNDDGREFSLFTSSFFIL